MVSSFGLRVVAGFARRDPPHVAGKTTRALLFDSPRDITAITSGSRSAARRLNNRCTQTVIVIFCGLHLAPGVSLATMVSKYVDTSNAYEIK